jgi:Fe-S-cluster containining protein
MAEPLRGTLPPVYRGIFNELFDKPKISETRATCNRCSMCDHGDGSPVTMEFFNPSTKCCTFFPQLPNYLVGAILADETPEMAEGKRRIQKLIAGRVGITPEHLSRPRKMSLILSAYQEAFGRAGSLMCPLYDGDNPAGNCTIWRHREAICMTYHCKYVDGQRGYDFWTALKNYLGHVQRTLAKNSAKAVDPKVIEPVFKKNLLSVEDIEDLPPKERDYAAWWGPWVGREEEFYLKCHEWVRKISPAEFAHNIDQHAEGKPYFDALAARYGALEHKVLPQSLVRNARMKEDHVGEKVVVTTYHRFDSFSLDKDLYEVVGLLKADQTLEQNLERLKTEEGIELTPDLIEYLFAAGVLVEPTKAKVEQAKDAKADAAAELNGRRSALGAILKVRGLTVDDADLKKIEKGDVAQLDAWIVKAVTAVKLADVLG